MRHENLATVLGLHGSWMAAYLAMFSTQYARSLEQIENWFERKRIVQMWHSLTSYDNIWHPNVMIFMILPLAFTFWTEFHRSNKSTLVGDTLFIQIENWPTKRSSWIHWLANYTVSKWIIFIMFALKYISTYICRNFKKIIKTTMN